MSQDGMMDEISEPVQLELPLEFPTPKVELPEDAPTTVANSNAFFKAVVLFPNFFGADLYEVALNWFTLTAGEKKLKIIEARNIQSLNKEDADV